MTQKPRLKILDTIVETEIIGLYDANNSNYHGSKDSDCLCDACMQDKQYLIWELEA